MIIPLPHTQIKAMGCLRVMGINAAAWKSALLSIKIQFPPRTCYAANPRATRLQCVRKLKILPEHVGDLLHVCTSLCLITA